MNNENENRKLFWDTLSKLHENSTEAWDKLRAVYRPPKVLCRFRSVNKNTLQQLQENKMFFSSADWYDDPFDTYFYINYNEIKRKINCLRTMIKSKNEEQIMLMLKNENFKYIDEAFLIELIKNLKKTGPNIPIIEKNLLEVRKNIQQQLFSICFCDDPLNENLWLKYADNHSGFVMIYNMFDSDVFLCGKEEKCKNCYASRIRPNVYPIYYSNDKYDATQYAISLLIYNLAPSEILEKISKYVNLDWEIERIALIKKRCHEYDNEWRMLYPVIGQNRPFIKMRPSCIAVGLRMPEYERRLVISAANIAGIKAINKIVINENNELGMERL